MNLFIENLKWLNQSCVLSHYFEKPCDRLSQAFPSIGLGCLKSKLGVEEDFTNVDNYLIACDVRTNDYVRLPFDQGPFFRAAGNDRAKTAFHENTVILPCGNVMFDVLNAYTLSLHCSNAIPKVKDDSTGATYSFNPYAFNYFNDLIKEYELVKTGKASSNFETDSCLKLLGTCLRSKVNVFFDAIYDLDALLLSYLIEPNGDDSLFLTEDARVILNANKTMIVENRRKRVEPPQNPPVYRRYKFASRHRNYTHAVPPSKRTQIKTLKFKTLPYLRSMFENVRYNHAYLKNILNEDVNPVSLFCIPSKIQRDGAVVREFKPNVKMERGLGLVAIKPIRQGDFFIVKREMKDTVYHALKTRMLSREKEERKTRSSRAEKREEESANEENDSTFRDPSRRDADPKDARACSPRIKKTSTTIDLY